MAYISRHIAWILIPIAVVGCSRDRTYITMPTAPTAPVVNTPTPPPVVTSKIEFRVFGNATSVRVRFSTQADGLTQTTTSLPFFTSFTTSAASQFLALEVTPLTFPLVGQPFMVGQIFVDGNLFREASSSDFSTVLSVVGNWRK